MLSSHWEVREKGVLKIGAGDSLGQAVIDHCSPGCKSRDVPWSLGDACLWGKKWREAEEGEGKHTDWVLYLEAFLSLLQVGILGRSQGRVSTEYSSVFQVCPFRGMVSTDWSVPGQGIISHCSWSWCHTPGFAAFLGLELKYEIQLSPGCYL